MREPLDPETEEWVDRLVDAAPPLTERQCAEIRKLFQDEPTGAAN
jgi:hypothetical protein